MLIPVHDTARMGASTELAAGASCGKQQSACARLGGGVGAEAEGGRAGESERDMYRIGCVLVNTM